MNYPATKHIHMSHPYGPLFLAHGAHIDACERKCTQDQGKALKALQEARHKLLRVI